MPKLFHGHVKFFPSYHFDQITDGSHGPVLTVQAGAGAGQTHGGYLAALYDLARPRQPDGDALRLYVLSDVLLLAANLMRSCNAHIMPPHVYS